MSPLGLCACAGYAQLGCTPTRCLRIAQQAASRSSCGSGITGLWYISAFSWAAKVDSGTALCRVHCALLCRNNDRALRRAKQPADVAATFELPIRLQALARAAGLEGEARLESGEGRLSHYNQPEMAALMRGVALRAAIVPTAARQVRHQWCRLMLSYKAA